MSTSDKSKKIKAAEFDQAFDEGDVSEYLDIKSAKALYPVRRVSIDFPKNVLSEVDVAASRIGVTRTSLIKMWVSERLDKSRLVRDD